MLNSKLSPQTPANSRAFQNWKARQADAVKIRGTGENASEEEAYISSMLRNVLQSHMCYRELDAYGKCLVDNKIISKDDIGVKEVNGSSPLVVKHCRVPMLKYDTCLGDAKNEDVIVEAALAHERCLKERRNMMVCLEKKTEEEQKGCTSLYRKTLICGLNFLWDEYWRAMGGFGEMDEYHVYENEKEHRDAGDLEIMANRYSVRLMKEQKEMANKRQ